MNIYFLAKLQKISPVIMWKHQKLLLDAFCFQTILENVFTKCFLHTLPNTFSLIFSVFNEMKTESEEAKGTLVLQNF